MLAIFTVLAVCSWRSGCRSTVRVVTFNIRMFPEPTTDFGRVASTIAELDADLLGLQEIADQSALTEVLARASEQTGRSYRAVLSRCRSATRGITTALAWDVSRWRLVEHREYPDLLPDRGVPCGDLQPGLLGIFVGEDGRRIGVLSVHLEPFPDRFGIRQEQWRRAIAIQRAVSDELGATVILLGDTNSTGFMGEPEEERAFVTELVKKAGFRLLTGELPCSEYWVPEGGRDYLPSLLDHMVVTGGRWGEPKVIGMCERLACRVTSPRDMDPDFVRVSDHCPVVVEGSPS